MRGLPGRAWNLSGMATSWLALETELADRRRDVPGFGRAVGGLTCGGGGSGGNGHGGGVVGGLDGRASRERPAPAR